MPDTQEQPEPAIQIHAAIATWLLPGLGHYMLGQRTRGLVLGVAILGLWLSGLLIGGVSVIDRSQHHLWFYGQAIIAPSIGVEWYHNRIRPQGGYIDPAENDYEPSYGKMNEQGLLFTALAGLLNLLAILDVVYCDPKHRIEAEALAHKARDAAAEAQYTGDSKETAADQSGRAEEATP